MIQGLLESFLKGDFRAGCPAAFQHSRGPHCTITITALVFLFYFFSLSLYQLSKIRNMNFQPGVQVFNK